MVDLTFWLIVLFLVFGTVLCFRTPRSFVVASIKRIPVEAYVLAAGFALMNAIYVAHKLKLRPFVAGVDGPFGDFVGGYVGTFFALGSVLLLYRTFTNQQQLSARTGFETKFYELLKLHRENVAEMHVKDVTGRRIFVLMIAELRGAHEIVRLYVGDQTLSTEEKWHIAYYFFYFGVGSTSTPMVAHALSGYQPEAINRITESMLRTRRMQSSEQIDAAKQGLTPKRPYVHFDGHQSRLGHYYRHLYQAIRFIDSDSNLSDVQKYSYAKMLRAQLSTHEQALLLINSLTPFGTRWWDDGLIKRYSLVKNLPPGFFDKATEIDTTLYFEPGYFEVDELQKRPKSRLLPSQ